MGWLGDRRAGGRVVVVDLGLEPGSVGLALDDEVVGGVDEAVDGALGLEQVVESPRSASRPSKRLPFGLMVRELQEPAARRTNEAPARRTHEARVARSLGLDCYAGAERGARSAFKIPRSERSGWSEMCDSATPVDAVRRHSALDGAHFVLLREEELPVRSHDEPERSNERYFTRITVRRRSLNSRPTRNE